MNEEVGMDKKFIVDFQENETISGYFCVLTKSLKKTKDGKDYISVELTDKTGKIDAKIWDRAAEFNDKFDQGDAVAVKGQIVSYNEMPQIKIDLIRQASEEIDKPHGFDLADLIPTTSKDIDQMWSDVQQTIESIGEEPLKSLARSVYQKNEIQLKRHPGSMVLHHAYLGGLLEHIQSMCNLAVHVCENYPELNRDLVLTGVLLHDIGKLSELKFTTVGSYSDEGYLLGHIVIGRDMLREAAAQIANFPERQLLKLEHILLSHHGKLEWQSPREPLFPEALAVYYIDEIDTRLFQMKHEIEADSSDGNWTSRNNYFKRSLYKGE